MGNLEDDGRPDWLPEKFNSPEVLAKSYRELEQAYTRLSTEKRELEEGLNSSDGVYTEEDWDALSAAEPYAQAVATNIELSEPVQTAQRIDHAASNMEVMKLLTEAARQAERQVDERVSQSLGMTPAPDYLTTMQAGVQQVRMLNPSFDENAVAAEIEMNPGIRDLVTRAIESNDAANVTTSLLGAEAAVQSRYQAQSEATQQSLLAMKQNAQTITGSMGRPGPGSSNPEWDAIRAAVPDRYAG